jgi:hypothetical protein
VVFRDTTAISGLTGRPVGTWSEEWRIKTEAWASGAYTTSCDRHTGTGERPFCVAVARTRATLSGATKRSTTALVRRPASHPLDPFGPQTSSKNTDV